MGNTEKKPERVTLRSLRCLMFLFPAAILMGSASILLFFIYLPMHPKVKAINALYAERAYWQEEVGGTKVAIEDSPENSALKTLLEKSERELADYQAAIDRHAPIGYYLHTITDRSNFLNSVFLNAIIGVGFIIVWYYLLISLFSSVPGLHILSINPLNSKNCHMRIDSLKRKFQQTGRDVGALREENEFLSSLDENRAVLSMMPFYFGEWVMPILGFLGTVIGVSGAINELQVGIRMVFGGTLNSSALEKFNGGFRALGMAFDTTFLGLIGLMLSGLLAFVLRRRAIAAIHAIDQHANDWIAAQEPESAEDAIVKKMMSALEKFYTDRIQPDAESARDETIKSLMSSVETWYNKHIKPDIDDERSRTHEFQDNLQGQVGGLQNVLNELPPRVVKPLRNSLDHQTLRINAYGEYLVRLAGMIWKAGDRSTRIQTFLANCLVEAAMGSPDDFLPALTEALKRPVYQMPAMNLLKESDGNGIECMAVSSSYYLAVAIPPSQYAKSKIEMYHLDMALNRKVANSKLEAEINATVTGLAFNAKGTLLAYLCADGALGVYDISNDRVSDFLNRNLHPSSTRIVWLTMGREYVALPAWIEEHNTTQLMLIPYENGCIGGSENKMHKSLSIKGFHCCDALFSARQSLLVLAGNSKKNACLKIVQAKTADTVSILRDIVLPQGRIGHITFSNVNEDKLLCCMNDGTVYQLSLTSDTAPELLADEKSPVLFAESEELGQYMVIGCEGRSYLQLYGAPDSAIPVNGYGVIKLGRTLPGHEGVVVAGDDGHLAMWEYPGSIWSGMKSDEGNRK